MSVPSNEKLANFPTRHYGASYKPKIPAHLNRYVPTAIYCFEVHPSCRKIHEQGMPLRSIEVKACSESSARREALKSASLGAWESLRLKLVEPNPEHLELNKALLELS